MMLRQRLSYLLLAVVLLTLSPTKGMGKTKPTLIPTPTPTQIKFKEAKLGVVFHYDLHVFDGKRYSQPYNRINPIPDYNIFNPQKLDTDQWIRAAKAAGAKFAILTATHETGFAIYQSNVNPYCMKALKWQDGKGDIVRDFVNSCRKYDILPGIYIGIRWSSFYGIHNFKAEGSDPFAKNRQEWYKKMCEGMVKEICSNYGDLFMIWFDGGADDPRGLGPDVEPIVNELQPNCLFYHNVDRADLRWGGSESGYMPETCWSTFPFPYSHHKDNDGIRDHLSLLKTGDPQGKYYVPAMADFPFRGWNNRHEWFWEPGDEDAIYPLEELIKIYENSAGHNATIIVGLTPNPDGLIPEGDVKRLHEWGDAIEQLYGSPIVSKNSHKNSLTIHLKRSQKVDRISLAEPVASGEIIRAYKVEYKTPSGKWKLFAKGESVGSLKIHRLETPIEANAFRIKVKRVKGHKSNFTFNIY